jgi:hypothetical protein
VEKRLGAWWGSEEICASVAKGIGCPKGRRLLQTVEKSPLGGNPSISLGRWAGEKADFLRSKRFRPCKKSLGRIDFTQSSQF